MNKKSIWDTRFTPPKVALDADVEAAFLALDDQWITMRGSHVLLDDNWVVVGGAGGKFAGQRIKPNKISTRATLSKPKYVKNVSKDGKGFVVPNVPVPSTLDGAEEYFKKMAEGYRQRREELPEKWAGGSEGQNAGKQAENFDSLARLAKEWRENIKVNGHLSQLDSITDKDEKADWAGAHVQWYFSHANDDPNGVAKWMAGDVFRRHQKMLTPGEMRYRVREVNSWR